MATFATGFQIGGFLSVALLIYGGYLTFASLFSASEADTRHAPPEFPPPHIANASMNI